LITQGLLLANNGDRVFSREFNEYTDEPVEPFSSVRETRYAAKLRKGQGITVEVDMKLTDDHDTGSTDHIAVEVRGYNGTLPRPQLSDEGYLFGSEIQEAEYLRVDTPDVPSPSVEEVQAAAYMMDLRRTTGNVSSFAQIRSRKTGELSTKFLSPGYTRMLAFWLSESVRVEPDSSSPALHTL